VWHVLGRVLERVPIWLIFRRPSDCPRPELAQRLAQSESRMAPAAFFEAQTCNKAGMILQRQKVGAELFDQLIQIESGAMTAAQVIGSNSIGRCTVAARLLASQSVRRFVLQTALIVTGSNAPIPASHVAV